MVALGALLLLRLHQAHSPVGAVVVAPLVLVVLAAQVVAALVVGVARVVAAHTQPAMVALVEMAGHWYWSFDHAAICRG